VGLSHNVLANTHREGEQLFVESIVHVQSVDLVADPATTGGLFEQVQTPNEQTTTEAIDWDALTLETLQARRPDLLASLTEIQHERAVDLMRRIDRLEQQLEAARPRTQSKEQSLLGEATAVRTATTQEFVSAIAGRR
jgi:thioesterase domain-containing protein